MQRVKLICLGRVNAKYYAEGVAEYQKRLAPYCRLELVELAEQPVDKNPSAGAIAAALDKEGAAILTAAKGCGLLVALCVEGKGMTSEDFAALLEDAAVRGRGDVAFVIGSSHGLAPRVKAAADVRLSLSDMTLPHQLARLVLAEQIYRAFMIRAGSKYHK